MLQRIANHARGNAVAYLALFVALSGTAVASTLKLKANSVGTAQLKNGAVTGRKVAKDTLTGANIKASTLGTVPSATNAANAATAVSATNATNATNAANATNATNATNAAALGGLGARQLPSPRQRHVRLWECGQFDRSGGHRCLSVDERDADDGRDPVTYPGEWDHLLPCSRWSDSHSGPDG
jgi:hypothetical protein